MLIELLVSLDYVILNIGFLHFELLAVRSYLMHESRNSSYVESMHL